MGRNINKNEKKAVFHKIKFHLLLVSLKQFLFAQQKKYFIKMDFGIKNLKKFDRSILMYLTAE